MACSYYAIAAMSLFIMTSIPPQRPQWSQRKNLCGLCNEYLCRESTDLILDGLNTQRKKDAFSTTRRRAKNTAWWREDLFPKIKRYGRKMKFVGNFAGIGSLREEGKSLVFIRRV